MTTSEPEAVENSRPLVPSLVIELRRVARRERRRDLLMFGARSVLLTVAAILGTLTIVGDLGGESIDFAGVMAVLVFVMILAFRLLFPESNQTGSREDRAEAVADLMESHAWRFALKAAPYGEGAQATTQYDSDGQFIEQIEGLLLAADDLIADQQVERQITSFMHDLRTRTWEERRAQYMAERVLPLHRHLLARGRRHGRLSRGLAAAVLTVELVGIPLGFLKAAQVTTVELLGFTSALAASIALFAEAARFSAKSDQRVERAGAFNLISDAMASVVDETEGLELVRQIESELCIRAEATIVGEKKAALRRTPSKNKHLSPAQYFEGIDTLGQKIWGEVDSSGRKFDPDIIVGVNPGGAVVGGVLSLARRQQLLPITVRDWMPDAPVLVLLESVLTNIKLSGDGASLKILVVDASTKTGHSLSRAVGLIDRALEDSDWIRHDAESPVGGGRYIVKTAVIALRVDPASRPLVPIDYWFTTEAESFPYGKV